MKLVRGLTGVLSFKAATIIRILCCARERSGVYRLEAAPLRGNNIGIPIWTAFLTKYVEARDQDFFGLERNGAVVTMCCPKPMPFVFYPNYNLQMTRGGEYVLEFESRGGELYPAFEACIGILTDAPWF